MKTATENLQLSTRGHVRIIKLARTLADLDFIGAIDQIHVSEALLLSQR